MEKFVEGVGFIVYKDGQILVEKRKLSKKLDPGKIVIPGGHVENGESPLDACKREIKEELDIECKEVNFVVRLPYLNPVENQNISYFLCQVISGKIKCLEAEEVFWIDPIKEVNKLDFGIDRKALSIALKMI